MKDKDLRLILIFELITFNLIIFPYAVRSLKDTLTISQSVSIYIATLLALNGIYKYVGPWLKKYRPHNKLVKFFDINSNPKQIMKFNKDKCINYIFIYSVINLITMPGLKIIKLLILKIEQLLCPKTIK